MARRVVQRLALRRALLVEVAHLDKISGAPAQPARRAGYVTCVPLVPLKAAAGAFGAPQHVDDAGFDWVELESSHRIQPGMFVAQVVGKSMEPLIPDGAFCLFGSPVTGTMQGKTVLVQLRDAVDPETGHRYTVKRYEIAKQNEVNSQIVLKPLNAAFAPIVLVGAGEDEVRIVAEFVGVVGTTQPLATHL